MPTTDFLLRIQVLKGFMIIIENKFLVQQVMTAIFYGRNNGIELPIITRVLEFTIVNLFIEEGYRMTFLT